MPRDRGVWTAYLIVSNVILLAVVAAGWALGICNVEHAMLRSLETVTAILNLAVALMIRKEGTKILEIRHREEQKLLPPPASVLLAEDEFDREYEQYRNAHRRR